MPDKEQSRPEHQGGGLSRRRFVRLATLAGAAVAAGCSRPLAPETPKPVTRSAPSTAAASATPSPLPPVTSQPIPTSVPLPTATSVAHVVAPETATVPAATTQVQSPVIQKFPDAPSRVVVARHSGAWSGDKLEPEALRQMLDAGITRLTGVNDGRQAWAALFKPAERVAIKVNTIAGSSVWTPVPLVNAVVSALVAAGVPAQQIVIWDRQDWELETAGFALNSGGDGPLCQGTGTNYRAGYTVGGLSTKLSEILLGCDALINMPVLKQHGITGMSFAMKNHYGTCNSPGSFHGNNAVAIPELNALAPIREKTRLIVGSDLAYTLNDYWATSGKSDGIYLALDPVAVDAVCLRTFTELKKAAGENAKAHVQRASAWLANAAKLGLGTNDEKQMQVAEVRVA